VALEQTEKNTMGLLLNFLDREEADRVLAEDTFVSSMLDLPNNLACETPAGGSEKVHTVVDCSKEEHEWGNLFAALDLSVEFSQEELRVFEEVEEEEEPLGSPRKKRRQDQGVHSANDCEEFGELQSYEEQVFLQLFEGQF
jgi:hypothetical protein